MSVWLPYVPIILIPGVLNFYTAWCELNKQCRQLIFFQPFRSLGMYFWSLFQLVIPCLLTIWLLKIASQPPLTYELYVDSLLIGVSFVGVLNSTPEILEVKPIYNKFVAIAYDLISDRQTGKTSFFWNSVRTELEQFTEDELDQVLKILDEYFTCDISLKDEERKKYRDAVGAIRLQGQLHERVVEIKDLIKQIRRHDMKIFLENIGFKPESIQKLFAPQAQ